MMVCLSDVLVDVVMPSSEFYDTKRCQADPTPKTNLRYRGTSLIRTPPPQDPTVALYLGTYGDLRGGGVF